MKLIFSIFQAAASPEYGHLHSRPLGGVVVNRKVEKFVAQVG